ncbi:MAG: hypothetical protein IJU43_04820 [Lachnospiraceae bacterium]|nr:hypothetical protein [Lachnospiraceae bacterium]
MGINKNELTGEQIRKAMECEDAKELMEFTKSEGFDITQEEAEAYLEELSDIELDEENLDKVAGGINYCENYGKACPSYINVG